MNCNFWLVLTTIAQKTENVEKGDNEIVIAIELKFQSANVFGSEVYSSS